MLCMPGWGMCSRVPLMHPYAAVPHMAQSDEAQHSPLSSVAAACISSGQDRQAAACSELMHTHPVPAHGARGRHTWPVAMIITAPLMKPEIMGWDRMRTKKPRRKKPTAAAHRPHVWS